MAGTKIFNKVQMKREKYNRFDLSHDVKLSGSMGRLIPICCMDSVPGDKWNLGCQMLVRFGPMLAPVMHRFDAYVHYYAVPKRLLWPKWEEYFAGPDEPTDYSTYTPPAHPFITISEANETLLTDYFGIPPKATAGNNSSENINAMQFAAYQMIWDEYYRDQNLQDSTLKDLSRTNYLNDGDNTVDSSVLFNLRLRAWEHDYFTSALPFAQKGEAVLLPLSLSDVPVKADNVAFPTGVVLTGTPANADVAAAANTTGEDLFAQTSEAVGSTTIRDLRRAEAVQQLLEKFARGGSRYTEAIRAIYGVTSSDKRLQRPEYITGSKTPITISEVLNTAGTFDPANPTDPASPPQGNMAGHGLAVVQGNYGHYFAEEHCYIIGILSVMPKTAYQQGIERQFYKINDRYEQYFSDLAHIGEQAVLKGELYAYSDNAGESLETFGYLPRYAEYKYQSNRVAGQFRTTLAYWHEGRIFTTGSTVPPLNSNFIMCLPDTRIFATGSESDNLFVQVLNQVSVARMMPVFGNPRLG